MTHEHVPTVAQRFGYRGRALSLLGIVWLLVGLSVAYDPIQDPDNLLILEQIPTPVRVSLWIGAGLVALITSWWPSGADRWGFMALVVPAAIRAGAYAWTSLMGLITDEEIGDTATWTPALSWAVIVAFVLLLASWPEPGELRRDMQ